MKTAYLKFSFSIIIASLAGFVPGAFAQTLAHRYSFNDTAGNPTFADAVGGASWDGTLIGSAVLDGSKLQLDGIGGFATLPGGLISSYSQVSIEFWASFSDLNPVWTRVFAFGDQDGGGNQRSGLDYCHYAGGNWQNLNFSTGTSGVYANNPGGLNGQTNVHVTIVVDPSGNRMFYYNGTAVASNPGVNGGSVPPLSAISDTFCLIGKSLYDIDALLEGSIDEFRIYQGAITPSQVALNDAAGPDNYVTDAGAIQSVSLISPANQLIVKEISQQVFTGDFANVIGVDLIAYGGATFSSGNTNILTVNATNGLVTAVAPGTTTVIGSFGGLSATNTLTVIAVPTTLTHRYSFTSDASDSVGTADGTLMGNATISGGKAVLDGTGGTYIDLPGGLINISTNGAVTIDAWVDFGDVPNWTRLFDFGNDGGSSELYLTPGGPGNGNNHWLSENISGGRTTEWRGAWRNLSLHVTCVIDPLNSKMAVYKNGVLEYERRNASAPLSLLSTNLAVIGRSLVAADPYLPASIDEFRIYTGALTPQEIAMGQQSGPDSVNRDPGELISIEVEPAVYPAYSGVIPAVVFANYANLSHFVLQPNNSAVVNNLVVTSSDTNVIAVNANNMLQTFRPGTVTLTATYLGKTNSAVVTVQNVGELAHRYSFASDANDSVGSANGTLQGNATVASDALVLDGSGGTYVELPPGLLEGYNAVTIDSWVTFNSSPSWIRLWYFGDDRANEFYLSPSFNDATVHSLQTGFPVNGGSRTLAPIWENQMLHITCVYGNGFIGIYTNGVLESSSSSNLGRMDEIGNSFSWIGRSPYPADPYMNCSVDEFRIYRGGLAPDEIKALNVLGPNELLTTVAPVTATVDGANTILSWPVAAAGFSVQSSTALGSGNWVTLTNAPTLVGNNWQVTIPNSSSAQFFRLWR